MQKHIVANWKMYKTIEEAQQFIVGLEPALAACEAKVLLAVPSTALWNAAKQAAGKPIHIGAQNIDFHTEGAFTGEISAGMVKDAGAQFVIVGHSERRKLFHESSEIVNLKAKAALAAGLTALVCIGETYEERNANAMEATLKSQLLESLSTLSIDQLASVVLAYEPIWAIGTGVAATSKDVYNAHLLCRQVIAGHWGANAAAKLPILYGGSVKPDNARELLETPEVDGLLVGSASLSVDSFSQILLSQQVLNFS